MNRLPRLLVASLLVLPVLLVPSCAAPQRLESVMVLPSNTTLQGFGLQVHYKAYGSFVHPPETLDISNAVTWSSSSPQIISIDNTGIATYVQGCATNLLITATYTHNGSVMVGTAALTAKDPACSQ